MGFSKTTKILAISGFVCASDLKEGELLRTPLGKTRITKITVTSAKRYLSVSDKFDVIRWKRVLLKDLSWGLIRIPEMELMFSLGVLPLEEDVKCNSNEIFSFVATPTDIVLKDKTDNIENVVITTENGILVADSFVCSATSQSSLFSTLPNISQNQLDEFFKNVSKFYRGN